MTRILFVDDEPRVLEGLRDLLRKRRREWDMVFVCGGPEAIALVAREPFDIVISDMRMPGADGIAVLRAVAEHRPEAARVVLSGHAGRSSVLEALSVAHQFLGKPCDPATLQTTIDDLIALAVLVAPPRVRAITGAVPRLPSGAAAYTDLTTAAVTPDASLDQMVRIVEQDPAMAAKVLQLVNSSFFGRAEYLDSARAAVLHMGLEPVRTLALAGRAFAPADGGGADDHEVERHRRHALRIAEAARALTPDARLADTAYTAGLLHDVGKLVLAAHLPEDYAAAQRRIASTGQATHAVEREIFGTTHAEVGAYLLGLWGLPALVVDTVAHHHDPERAPNNPLIGVLIAAHANPAAAGDAA